MYNEDARGTLHKNGIAIYNIGNEDGTLKSSWGEVPSATFALTGQGNTEGNVWGTSHGVFVAQNRTSGNNNASATSLKFYDWNGTQQLSSAEEPYNEIIDGTNGGGYAVSPDESMIVVNDGSAQFLVFDIAWENDKPILTLRYAYNHGITSAIRQMNFDYAGNLVVTGDNVVCIYTMPIAENVTTTPAKKALAVGKGDFVITNVEDTELSAVVYSNNGTIFVEAEAGAMIEVYTVLGQRLFAAEATTNLTAISNIPANIVLVKVNNQVVKVALR